MNLKEKILKEQKKISDILNILLLKKFTNVKELTKKYNIDSSDISRVKNHNNINRLASYIKVEQAIIKVIKKYEDNIELDKLLLELENIYQKEKQKK